jgi:HK97 family phage portal protein
MGLFDRFNKKIEERKVIDTYFKMFNSYSPVFSNFKGGVYEMELTRASIHTFATHFSKASPVIKGDIYKGLENILKIRPNEIMSTTQFLYKVATIYKAENNCFIIPLYEDRNAGRIIGFYPVRAADTQITTVDGVTMLKYTLYPNGTPKKFAIPYAEVGHLRSHFYRNEFYGESNAPMNATMDLLAVQQQAIKNSVQQSATIRFMAKLVNMLKPEDLKKEQERLRDTNLSVDNNGGIFMYDNKYSEVKQVDSKPFTIDAEQMKLIQNNVFNYFGTNEEILQGRATESQWEAYYESQLEPLLIELSQVMTHMLFNTSEVNKGSYCVWEGSRLQYASTKTKMELWSMGYDRGLFTRNDGRTLFNMPNIEGGDEFMIRLEYGNAKGVSDSQE